LRRRSPLLGNREKDTRTEIPIGTKITQVNWQQYQQFMTEGMKAVFAGTYFWHMPKNVEIEVGPTKPIPAPKPYLQDTEKYSSQVTLEPLPDGGYVPKGYVAGFPFSNPLKDDPSLIGERIYWDTFYRPSARVEEAPNCSYLNSGACSSCWVNLRDRAASAARRRKCTALAALRQFARNHGLPSRSVKCSPAI
jgi:hypothetical protein